MDWSPTTEGNLVTGDCANCVYLTRPTEASWATDPVPFVGHVGSVEDLQWSPTESTVGTDLFVFLLVCVCGGGYLVQLFFCDRVCCMLNSNA